MRYKHIINNLGLHFSPLHIHSHSSASINRASCILFPTELSQSPMLSVGFSFSNLSPFAVFCCGPVFCSRVHQCWSAKGTHSALHWEINYWVCIDNSLLLMSSHRQQPSHMEGGQAVIKVCRRLHLLQDLSLFLTSNISIRLWSYSMLIKFCCNRTL